MKKFNMYSRLANKTELEIRKVQKVSPMQKKKNHDFLGASSSQ